MKDYQIIANQYRDIRESLEGQERKEVESKVIAYQFLADADRNTQLELFNSGAFNVTIKGYLLLALDNLETEEQAKGKILNEINKLLENVDPEEAEKYFLLKA